MVLLLITHSLKHLIENICKTIYALINLYAELILRTTMDYVLRIKDAT